jgi:predicted transposase/invertase (TIGR01784 family)
MPTPPPPFVRYAPFTSDFGFKVTFGNEVNTLFLRRAIQAMIGLEQPIKSLIFEKNNREAPTVKGRHVVYDLTCKLDNGEIVIVEMQIDGYPNMVKRLEYYATIRMIPFVKKGKWMFTGIPRIYSIAIMAQNLFADDDYHRVASLYDKRHRLVDDSLQFIFIELDKFDKAPDLCVTDLDKLIFTMKSLPQIKESDEMPDFMQEPWLAAAIKELDAANLSPDERASLEIAVAREVSSQYAAEQWAEFVEARGKAQGEEIGMEKGIKIGKEEGKEEGLRQSILNVLLIHPEWTDASVSKLLNVPVEMVAEERKKLIL